MQIVIVIALLVLLIAGPGLWVRRVMKQYSSPTDRYGHSGAETARRLLDELAMAHVKVELTEAGDHYDPIEKPYACLGKITARVPSPPLRWPPTRSGTPCRTQPAIAR